MTVGRVWKVSFAGAGLLLLVSCLPTRAPESDALASELRAVLARHPGALKGASPKAEALVDDLVCMSAAWAEQAEQFGCGGGK